MKYIILSILLYAGPLSAQDQQTQIANVARQMITHTTAIKLTKDNTRVSPQIEQQIRRLSDSLATVYPIPKTARLSQSPPETASQPNFLIRLQKPLLIGAGIFLLMILVQFSLKKYDEKRTGGRMPGLVNIHHDTRNAPYVLALFLPSQTSAESLAREWITLHLIARADILPQQRIASTENNGVMLVVQTVKSRLKPLQKHLAKQTLTAIPVPILKGHKDHLQWIVNTADGKGSYGTTDA